MPLGPGAGLKKRRGFLSLTNFTAKPSCRARRCRELARFMAGDAAARLQIVEQRIR
jgi:hypothetical protein